MFTMTQTTWIPPSTQVSDVSNAKELIGKLEAKCHSKVQDQNP